MSINSVEFCKALADETRQKILVMLQDGEMSVNDIAAEFDLSQPSISHHLAILKQFRLVTSRKEGKQVFYTLDRDHVVECCGQLMLKFDVQAEGET